MNVTAVAKEILDLAQEHSGAGKKKDAVKAVADRLVALLEDVHTAGEDVLIQVDLNCGVYEAAWVNDLQLAHATILIVERPEVGDEDGTGVYLDDDRVIVAVQSPQLMTNVTKVFAAIDKFE